jgi:hypothetical protein
MNTLKAMLPLWRSHKIVRAAEIQGVVYNSKGAGVRLADPELPTVNIPISVFDRYKPVAGDFFVMYEDDYQSISPRKAFIEGYSKIDGQEPSLFPKTEALSGMSPISGILIGAAAVLIWEAIFYGGYKLLF